MWSLHRLTSCILLYSSSLLLACCTPPAYCYPLVCVLLPLLLTRNCLQVEVKVNLRLTASQSVIFITLWQLRSCFSGAPSLTRRRVCLSYMLVVLASAVILGSEFLGTRDHILLSQIEASLFVASYDSQGHGGSIRTRLHTGDWIFQSQSYVTTDGSVGQSVLE
jgi:hypothetical protein